MAEDTKHPMGSPEQTLPASGARGFSHVKIERTASGKVLRSLTTYAGDPDADVDAMIERHLDRFFAMDAKITAREVEAAE